MFTGIIEEIGVVSAVSFNGESGTVRVKAHRVLEDSKVGDSICTDGICLTITSLSSAYFDADFMSETYRRTKIQGMRAGCKVNLERALAFNGRLGGHLVSGHIDGIGTVTGKEVSTNSVIFKISIEERLMKFVSEKGSVAVDGVSLTVSETGEGFFKVAVIPHTQFQTTLLGLETGDKVNIETDMIAKYIDTLIKHEKGSLAYADLVNLL